MRVMIILLSVGGNRVLGGGYRGGCMQIERWLRREVRGRSGRNRGGETRESGRTASDMGLRL